jgi:type IV pilus assembly protein PilF
VSKFGLERLGATLFACAILLAACATTGKSTVGDGELATSSDQTSAQKRAAINLQLAVGYYQRNEFEVALDKIKQSLLADPDYAEAYSMRGLIYMQMNETHLPDENFQHALKLGPNNGEFSNNYGWFLCQNGRAAESIAYFDAAVRARNYPAPAKALDNAGMCSLKLNDHAAAERYFLRAFQVDPGNTKVNANLARMYYERQDYEHAKFYIGRVIKSDVHDADVLWLGAKIAHKMGDRMTESAIGTQLQRYQPNSLEYASYQREAFDE